MYFFHFSRTFSLSSSHALPRHNTHIFLFFARTYNIHTCTTILRFAQVRLVFLDNATTTNSPFQFQPDDTAQFPVRKNVIHCARLITGRAVSGEIHVHTHASAKETARSRGIIFFFKPQTFILYISHTSRKTLVQLVTSYKLWYVTFTLILINQLFLVEEGSHVM